MTVRTIECDSLQVMQFNRILLIAPAKALNLFTHTHDFMWLHMVFCKFNTAISIGLIGFVDFLRATGHTNGIHVDFQSNDIPND